jgi:DNA-directed RNA polymerase specialized sigma24 family protein
MVYGQLLFIGSGRSLVGYGAGEIADAVGFSILAVMTAIVEACEKMMNATVRFRSVLRM